MHIKRSVVRIANQNEHEVKFPRQLAVALTMLVVAHHSGQPFGGKNGWWYFANSRQTTHLGHFFAVNAAFFMSLFFLISAYFLPASYDKKGAVRFLQDRLQRLGIPLLIGFVLMIPLMMYAYYIHFRGYPAINFGEYYLNIYFGMGEKPLDWTGPSWPDLQFGHLWFIEHLLVYAVLYTIWRSFIRKSEEKANKQTKTPNHLRIVLFAIVVSLITFVVRIRYPIDHWVGVLGFIQAELAHVPQYASFFIIGIWAKRNNWIQTLPAKVGRTWLIAGILLAAWFYSGQYTVYAQGGLNWNSFAYSFYETFLCTGLCIGLICLFRETMNVSGELSKALSANAYAVYIFHVPIVVLLQYSLANVENGSRLHLRAYFLPRASFNNRCFNSHSSSDKST